MKKISLQRSLVISVRYICNICLSVSHSLWNLADIRAVPFVNPKKPSLDAGFLTDAHFAVQGALNLASFTCTIAIAIPSFLKPLQEKGRLQFLRLNTKAMTSEQAIELKEIKHLHTLILDYANYFVVNMLPEWADKLKPTLRHLTINVCISRVGSVFTTDAN